MTTIRPRPIVDDIPRLSGRTIVDATSVPASHAPRAQRLRSSEHTWAQRYTARLRVTDYLIIVASIATAYVCRFGLSIANTSVSGFTAEYFSISLLIAVTWIVALYVVRSRDPKIVGMGLTEYKRVASASAVTFGILAIFFLIAKVDIARGYFILALPLGAGMLLISRWSWRQWLIGRRRRDEFLSRAIVVGERDDVAYVVNQIQGKAGAGYNIVGAAVDGASKEAVRYGQKNIPVVADLQTITQAASTLHVDAVIVAGRPQGGGTFIRSLSWALEGTATELVLATSLVDVAGPRIHFRPVEGLPLIHVEIPQFEGGKHVLKRAMDIALSGLALLFLAPLMIGIGIAIRLDTAGPALFRQERVGRNGSTFRMLKFRSMVQNAEASLAVLQAQNEGAGLLFKMKNDPRITRIGKVLRKYSLDELPQLWNVLVGDMSLVGPRPPLRREVEGYESHVHRRLYIKPGLTGMWQVNGRSDLAWDESVRLDLYYVENWSITGDLVIMWRTARVVIQPSGAY